MRRLFLPFTYAALLLCLPAVAGAQQRPLVTEDPEPIGAGRVLVEMGVDRDWDVFLPISGLRGDLLTLRPGFSVGLSDFAEVQFDGGVFQQMQIKGRTPAPFSNALTIAGDTTSDSGDLSVATKIRLMREAPGLPSIGFRFATRLPNASNESGLGQDTTDFLTQLLVGKKAGHLRMVVNGGLLIQDDATALARQDDLIVYGVSAAFAVTPTAEVVGEFVGRQNFADQLAAGAESRGIVRVGGRYTHRNLRVDGAVMFGRTGDVPDHGVTFGFTWITQAFRVH